ncbi:MAG: polyphosphate kinase 2 family protein [Nitrososphaerales archaeon]
MPKGVHTNRYMVQPGSKLNLEGFDPNDTSGFDGEEADAVTISKHLDQKLDRLQERLYAEHKHKVLIVLQAMDTGGKDGTIRRIFDGVNPSGVRVAHFGVPTPQEQDHDFLWRVHAQVPGKGELVIFNRSHYEGVLVERVHGLVAKKVWKMRYKQINDFERLLSEEGTTVLKFFLYIDEDEQKRRLQERVDDPEKQWKFKVEDLAERKLWPQYMKAYQQAMQHTSTEQAPWYIVPANNEWFRDLLVSSVVVDALEGLRMEYPPLLHDLKSVVIK